MCSVPKACGGEREGEETRERELVVYDFASLMRLLVLRGLMYVCVYICVCIYTHIHTYTHKHTHTHTHTYIYRRSKS